MNPNAPVSMMPWLRDGTVQALADSQEEELTVGEVATLVGVSIRTLHHWDAIGLVQPEGRTPAGYRSYSVSDIERIHRVLVYRELGFRLDGIAALLDDPEVDEQEQLRSQRDMLTERIGRFTQMREGVEAAMQKKASGGRLSVQQQAELFGQDWREEWAEEAYDRWGESDQWAQFEQNIAGFSAAQRKELHDRWNTLYEQLAVAQRSGVTPASDQGMVLAEQHRSLISAVFACTPSMHACLARLYRWDERYRAQIDRYEPGLTDWLVASIEASVRQQGIDPATAGWE